MFDEHTLIFVASKIEISYKVKEHTLIFVASKIEISYKAKKSEDISPLIE